MNMLGRRSAGKKSGELFWLECQGGGRRGEEGVVVVVVVEVR